MPENEWEERLFPAQQKPQFMSGLISIVENDEDFAPDSALHDSVILDIKSRFQHSSSIFFQESEKIFTRKFAEKKTINIFVARIKNGIGR